jgi:hypothetical protein
MLQEKLVLPTAMAIPTSAPWLARWIAVQQLGPTARRRKASHDILGILLVCSRGIADLVVSNENFWCQFG